VIRGAEEVVVVVVSVAILRLIKVMRLLLMGGADVRFHDVAQICSYGRILAPDEKTTFRKMGRERIIVVFKLFTEAGSRKSVFVKCGSETSVVWAGNKRETSAPSMQFGLAFGISAGGP
jgi:hypothetical protein